MLVCNSVKSWICAFIFTIASVAVAQNAISIDQSVYWPTEDVAFGLNYTNNTGSTLYLSDWGGVYYMYKLDDSSVSNIFDAHFDVYSPAYLLPDESVSLYFDLGKLSAGTHSLSGKIYSGGGGMPIPFPITPEASVDFDVAVPNVTSRYDLDFEELDSTDDGAAYGNTGIKFYKTTRVSRVNVDDFAGDTAMVGADTIRFYSPQWSTDLELGSDVDTQVTIEVDYSSDGIGDFVQFGTIDIAAGAKETVGIFLPDHHFIHAVRLTSSAGEIYLTDFRSIGGYIDGDFTHDDRVDIFDFLVLKSNYGRYSDVGDFDGDGDVDMYDFLLLKSMYGIWGIR